MVACFLGANWNQYDDKKSVYRIMLKHTYVMVHQNKISKMAIYKVIHRSS